MEHPSAALLDRRRLIRNGLIVVAGGFRLPGLWSGVAKAQTPSVPHSTSQTWSIGNDRLVRTVTFVPGLGLLTENLSDTSTHADFLLPSKIRMDMAAEFSFQANGHTYHGNGSAFELLGADEAKLPNGRSLSVRLRHNELDLDVTAVYISYDRHPAILKHLVFRNTSSKAIRLTHLSMESLGLTLGPENETILDAQYGTVPREIFYTGRSEDAGLLLSNSRTGIGVAILNEAPGYMKRTEIGGWDDPDRVRLSVMYDTDLMPFERSLASGEEFKTAGVSLVTFRRDGGFHDPRWALPSYTADILERRVDQHGPPWIYNTWEPFERGINRETSLALVEAAGAMGMDVFTIDDGWQQEYGENVVDQKSFPGGLRSIQEAVEARGMRLGLWIPLAAIGMATRDYRSHPEWASQDQEGKRKITSTMAGSKVVMCLASPFRDAAADRINDAIEQFHLAYVKLDLTTVFNAYSEAPGCWAKGHYHATWAESLNRIYEGIAYVTGKVYRKHPDVLLDLTFELWGQKHVIDAGLLAAGDLDWMSNVDDTHPDSAGPIQARQLLYQRAASMPVESMLIGNIHAELPTIQESFATAIGSAPLLLGDLRKLSPSDLHWYHEKIAWFKDLRRKTKISESFFPLGSWRQTSSGTWDGFARMATTGDGLIALFRNRSGATCANVQISVMPQGKSRIRSVFTGKDLGVFTTTDWSRGISIAFSDAAPVDVLEVIAVE